MGHEAAMTKKTGLDGDQSAAAEQSRKSHGTDKSRLDASGMVKLGLAIGAGWLLATQYPDIKRYLKMRNM